MFVYGLCVSSPILSLYLILIYMYFGLQIDRGNLIQAVSDSLLDDLNLPTNGISPTYLLHGYSADTIGKRLQHRKHQLPRLFSLRRVAPTARLEETWSGSLDSHADLPVVHRGDVSGWIIRKRIILGYSCSARCLGGIPIPHPDAYFLCLT